jgi:DNA adenine methylase
VRAEAIRAAHPVPQDIAIHNEDFAYIETEAESGDLVYFDPPYQPVSETADFTEYQADGFEKDDQKRLRDVALTLDEAGASVVISNSPPVAELYREYEAFSVNTVSATRAINSDADNRDAVAEVIITNVPQKERQRRTLSDFGE